LNTLMHRCAVLALPLVLLLAFFETGFAQERQRDASLQSIMERLDAIENTLDNERHNRDQLAKRIDDLLWYQIMDGVADMEKVRYTGPTRHQPNPTAQDAGNPLIIYAYVFFPKNLDRSKKHPLLVFAHGGVRSNFNTNYSLVVRELIEQGYVVVATDYRGSTGYGRAFFNQIDYGGREIDDVYLGGQWVLEHYSFIDPNRVGILGWSHGGFLTLWNIFNHPAAYKVAYAGVPVSNLALRAGTKARGASGYPVDDYGAPSGINKSAIDNVKEYVRRSPAYNTDKLQTPLLIHTATNDSDVNVFEVEQLIDAMKARGKKFEYKIYQDPPGEHSFELINTSIGRSARLEVYRFLSQYLNPPNPPARETAK
jgi:dipeptidyl aminopeptidase/acylaminoacyl peptidase